MLVFDDDAHDFNVAFPSPTKVGLNFGPTKVFVTMAVVPNLPMIETAMAGGKPLFNSGLIPPAIRFSASCVVLGKAKGGALSAAQLLAGYEFGFVQGIQQTDVIFEYWGQRAGHGRTVVNVGMPGTWEVDTDPAMGISPWTRIAAERFSVAKGPAAPGKAASVKVSAEFEDHPMFFANHTMTDQGGSTFYLRAVLSKRTFRTVFCYRDKVTKKFAAISSTDWRIQHHHVINYSDKGKTRTVIDKVGGHFFPKKGDPSNVNADDKSLMQMAQTGSPLFTPAVLASRMGPGTTRTVATEQTNSEFDSSFWQ